MLLLLFEFVNEIARDDYIRLHKYFIVPYFVHLHVKMNSDRGNSFESGYIQCVIRFWKKKLNEI